MSGRGRVAVVGGGITGLTAAWQLMQDGVDVHLFEGAPRVGGVIQSSHENGYRFEKGPNSIQGGREEFLQFCHDAGLAGEIIRSSEAARDRYLYFHGRLQSFPKNVRELLFSCDLLTPLQKARVLAEPLIQRSPPDHELSVAEWMGRRLGRGVTMTWVDVMVSGIYGGNPNRLGIRSAFPQVWQMEQDHGSMVKAFFARQKARRASGGEQESKGGMLSFRGGMETMPRMLGEQLGERVHLRRRVDALEKQKDGTIRVSATGPGASETGEFERVILASPASNAGMLLAPIAPDVADLVFEVEYVSMATVQAGFDASQLPGMPDGFGYLVPRCVRLRSLGWIFLSKIFEGAAPEGKVAMTGFLGGSLDPHALDISDGQTQHLMLGELALALRQEKTPRPEVFKVTRWRDVIPQYNVGHGQRIAAARKVLALQAPQIFLAGNWVDGVAVDRCVASGRAVARACAASLASTSVLP